MLNFYSIIIQDSSCSQNKNLKSKSFDMTYVVENNKVIVSIPTSIDNGLVIIEGYGGNKSFLVAFLKLFNAELIGWTQSNLYTNSSCTINGNANSGFKMTIQADQIVSNFNLITIKGRVYGL